MTRIIIGRSEVWKDIVWYEWLYQVSDLGRVKSLDRTMGHKKSWISKRKWKILKLSIWNWYYKCSLSRDSKVEYRKVHRLKAIAFIPNPENKLEVCHRDNNPLNNWLHEDGEDNLYRWTRKENMGYCRECGRTAKPWLWRTWESNPKSKKVNQYTLDWILIKTRNAANDIQRTTWYNSSFIWACCLEKYWRKTAYWCVRKFA